MKIDDLPPSRYIIFVTLIMWISPAIARIGSSNKNIAFGSISAPAAAPAQGPIVSYGSYPTEYATFDILSFGAQGNGFSDDTKALEAAWSAACKISGATIIIPSDYDFLIKPTTLKGPCMPHLTLQVRLDQGKFYGGHGVTIRHLWINKIDGTLLAAEKGKSWKKSDLLHWLNFKWVHNFTVQGSGIVDGHGSSWWGSYKFDHNQKKKYKTSGQRKPTALRFYAGSNIMVREIRIVNSPQCHLKFDNCKGVNVENITISSPENSPNTDGIHLQNTQDVEIRHSYIASGDDCVSIQTGCTNVAVHHIKCGPGHGISIGALGKDGTVACVSNVIIDQILMNNTMYGARIKTWQGGAGRVKNVSFTNIQVSDVKVPIMIDQYYCDSDSCEERTQAVAISGVKFDQIRGTYSKQPIHIACSKSIPCDDVNISYVHLQPSPTCEKSKEAFCWNTYGKTQGSLTPSNMGSCLQNANGPLKKKSRSHENTCGF